MSRGKCENIERLKLTFELKILMTGKEFGRKFIEGGLNETTKQQIASVCFLSI